MGSGVLNREEAFDLLKRHVKDERFVKHCIAVEAIMRRLAKRLGEDEEVWGLAGLLHDIDYEFTRNEPEKHGVMAKDIIGKLVPEPVMKAIMAHNFENTGIQPTSTLDKALIASDAASGLLVACALVMPSKKMEEVKLKTVLRKFKAKDFARGVSRRRIRFCEQIGLSLEDFLEEALKALKDIADTLGL